MLNEEEIKQAEQILTKLPSGSIPEPIFYQIARLVPLPVVEVVLLQRRGEQIEVLLTQRSPSDPFWPNLWHIPGTVIRITDSDPNLAEAFDRILNVELGNLRATPPKLVRTLFRHSKRGAELALVYSSVVLGQPTIGQFFPNTALPTAIVETHPDLIQEAVLTFRF